MSLKSEAKSLGGLSADYTVSLEPEALLCSHNRCLGVDTKDAVSLDLVAEWLDGEAHNSRTPDRSAEW